MKLRTLGAVCGLLPLISATPAVVSAQTTVERHTSSHPAERVLEGLRARSARAGDPLKLHEGGYGTPRYLSGVLSDARPAGVSIEAHARAFLTANRQLLPLDGSELRLIRTTGDKAGGSHLRFEQYYHGVPVFNAKLNIHMDRSGVIRAVNSSAVAGIKLDVNPTLSPDDIETLLNVRQQEALVQVLDAELKVYPTRSRSYLVYQVPMILESGPRVVWIDAHTGRLVYGENPMREGSTTGSGIDAQGNPVDSINIYQGRLFPVEVSPLFRPYIQTAARGKYNLVDLTTPDQGYIYTFTSNQTYLANIDYVNSSDNSFDDTSNHNQPSGVSAHTYFRDTLDFYQDVFDRSGLDDEGLSISAVVEVNGTPQVAMECNAGWLGYGFNFMIFGMGGDCFDLQTYPFSASLDVIGHELNHGVDEFTINLGYNHESGALNEHFADVFGILDEAYNSTPDWLIGEELFIDPYDPDLAFRDFSDPAADSVLMAQPDSMSVYFAAPVSYDAGGVHFNSGIVNKAFYLLVEGGTFNGVTVPKIGSNADEGRSIAGALWYDVMVNERISSISQFNDLRDALIDAAESLYPSKVTNIQATFQAVGVVDDLYPTSSQDLNEPNDYPGLAMPLTVGSTTSQYIWSRNDADIYSIELTSGQQVTITLSNLAFDGDLGLYTVLQPYDTVTSVAESTNDGTADEVIQYTPTSGGTFYIEVIPNDNSGNRTQKYKLSATRG